MGNRSRYVPAGAAFGVAIVGGRLAWLHRVAGQMSDPSILPPDTSVLDQVPVPGESHAPGHRHRPPSGPDDHPRAGLRRPSLWPKAHFERSSR